MRIDIAAPEIKSSPSPSCAICGQVGTVLYPELRDKLFDAPGLWSLKRCPGADCGVVWPDPMPLPEEIGKAYAQYYTHSTQPQSQIRVGFRRRYADLLLRAYWAKNYGYRMPGISFFARVLGKFYYSSPIHRREADAAVRCLYFLPHGRLLDVGCGSGDWMCMMKDLGWDVSGNDFDGNAVRIAVQKGLNVSLGSLEAQKYPSNSFDAITLSHVIEHVPYPVETMRECHRILKPGGKIILLTPNSQSLSHRVFGGHWRGLEPPRHLHIFTLSSMRRLLQLTQFGETTVRPFIVTSVIYDSLLLYLGKPQNTRSRILWAATRLFKYFELLIVPFAPRFGDCLIASATKPPQN